VLNPYEDLSAGAGHGAARPGDEELATHANRVRELVVQMCAGPEGGHLGGSMSLVEILVALYFSVLRADPVHPDAPDRDIFVLSKGHGALAYYATLAVRGFIPESKLAGYGGPDSMLTAHPNPAVPGVEMPTGSLGHGLALGVGFAMDIAMSGSDRRCFVVLGDGELQEGSIWEAAMSASSQKLDRLVAIVDRNGLQLTGSTEDTLRLEPLADRWRSFGWSVIEVDGHDLGRLRSALAAAPPEPGRPTVVLANTVKGKGLPYVEGQVRSHYARLSGRQRQRALATLAGHHPRESQT
jgi:transketolase